MVIRMDYLSALNEKQQKAVCETEGYEKADERVVRTIKEEKRLSQQSLQQESVCKTDTPNLADYENL